MYKKAKNKGFSLIELMVVIAIMGILATVAIAYLRQAQEKSRHTAALTTGAGIVPGLVICADEENDISLSSDDTAESGKAAGGGALCASGGSGDDTLVWPTLPARYKYTQVIDGDSDNPVFGIQHENPSKSEKAVACDVSGCKDCEKDATSSQCTTMF